MLSLKKLERAEQDKKQAKKIERELPYFITIVTLLATSGMGPYSIFQKIKDLNLLPTIRHESIKIIKRIDMLGLDPLTVLSQAKEKSSSRALGDFLAGYVSAIQSGGNVINYLKSKMSSSFEMLESKEKGSIEKISGLVHAYLTMQIVILAVFILVAAVGSNPLSVTMGAGTTDNFTPPYPILIFPPIMSLVFIKVAQRFNYSNISELQVKKILRFGLPSILIPTILIFSNVLSNFHVNSYIVGIGLVAASLWPTLHFRKVYTKNLDAETATPQILRDITEARKAGLGPEKCIIRACKRKDYRTFNTTANAISNKLEWGIPMNHIFDSLYSEIKNFQVLVSFRILFEIITSGGGNVNTLDSLADTSEKIYNIEKNKREMLKPYIMVGFMLITITGFTTLLTIDSFASISQQSRLAHQQLSNEHIEQTKSFFELISIAVIVQAWLAGLFIGKITQGAFSGGFQFSAVLVIITMIAISIIQLHLINIGSILKTATPV
jgi:flagellar protein FlaJ